MSHKRTFCIKYKSGDQGYSDELRIARFDHQFYTQTTSKTKAIAEFNAAIKHGGIPKGSRRLEVIDMSTTMKSY